MNKLIYTTFVDLEKAVDLVPQKVIWLALRKHDVDLWFVRLVSMVKDKDKFKV